VKPWAASRPPVLSPSRWEPRQASARRIAPIRTVGLLAPDRHHDLCFDAVLELARGGRLPLCLDLLGSRDEGMSAVELVLLARAATQRLSGRYRQAAEAVLHSGTPVLLLPRRARRPLFGSRALIIWDGSFGAIVALRHAVPLLAHANEIMLVDAADGHGRVPLREAIAILETLPADKRIEATRLKLDTSPSVLEAARLTRADYLVMGGFGRWNALPGLLHGGADATFVRSRIPMLVGQ
jgi:nucleotide-binding universal stress UspA family protein